MRPPKYLPSVNVEQIPAFVPADERELARLLKKYGPPIIAKLAPKVPRPRHGPRPSDPLIPPQPLTLLDLKALMRLVGKYGSDFVAEAARVVASSKMGRRSRGDLPMLERINLTEWIQDAAEDYGRTGSKMPFRDAELDVYDLQNGKDHNGVVPESFFRTIKRKRMQGRKELNEALELSKRRARSLSRKKNRL